MLYPLMNIVGPILLLAVILWGLYHWRIRSRRIREASDEGTRELRERLNQEDTGQALRRD